MCLVCKGILTANEFMYLQNGSFFPSIALLVPQPLPSLSHWIRFHLPGHSSGRIRYLFCQACLPMRRNPLVCFRHAADPLAVASDVNGLCRRRLQWDLFFNSVLRIPRAPTVYTDTKIQPEQTWSQ